MAFKHRAARWMRDNAPPEDWRNLIRASTQEEAVLELVRDHMARWTPQELARLPEDCRPRRIRDAEDLSRWAFDLASTHCAQGAGAENEAVLDRMLELVTQAAIRLSELKATAASDTA